MKTRLYTLLIDASSSMRIIRQPVVDAINRIVETIAQQSLATRHTENAIVRVLSFTSKKNPNQGMLYAQLVPPTDVFKVRPLTYRDYIPGGWTPLVQAISENIASYIAHDTHLMYVLTDGEENSSLNRYNCETQIRESSRLVNFTLAVQGPKGSRARMIRLGVPPGNIEEWEQTEEGTIDAAVSTQSGIARTKRAYDRGETKTCDFYAKTDASRISDPRRVLDNLTDRFKYFAVREEARADEFTTKKTRRQYVIGQTYYQLMKTEKITADKDIVLRDKNTNIVYGGPDVRPLIGLSKTETQKVYPGNHAQYDIFVQSKSVNRKLPRDTKVLIDMKRRINEIPTWDHTQGASNG